MTQLDLRALSRRLGIAFVVVWFAALVRVAAVPLNNKDTYFHLRFGHEFLTGWSPWSPGTITTVGTKPWVPTQWLSEVVMAAAERWGGLSAVAWLFGTTLVGFALTLYVVCRTRVTAGLAASLTVGCMVACVYGLSARPQLLSYLFMAVVVHAWLRTADDGRKRWWLVPLTWLWAMCHGMWPLAIVLGVGVACALGLERRSVRVAAGFATVPLASFVAAGLTPVGPRLYGAVLVVAGRGQFFTEWAAPDFTKPIPALGAALVGLTVLLAVRGGPLRWSSAVVLGFAGAALIWSNRTVPIAAVVATVLTAELLARVRPVLAGRGERGVVALGAVGASFALALAVPHTSDEPEPQPAWLATELQALPAGSRVLGDDLTDGQLVWQYPRLDILYFGYGDLYSTAELDAKDDLFKLEPGWERTVARLDPHVALMMPDLPLTYALEHTLQWRVVHRSDDVVMLVPPTTP